MRHAILEVAWQAWIVSLRDLKRFWQNIYWLAGQVAMNIADLLIFGLIFRGVVKPELIPDYIRFITPGILCLSIFISSFTIGREVGVELRREVTQYLVSLPVTRGALVAGRVLGGVLRGFMYQAGFLLLAVILMGPPTLERWLLILLVSLMIAITMSSLSITLVTLTRDFNLQAAIRSMVYFAFFFISNVFYPERALEARLGPLAPIARYSPVSMAVSIYRHAFNYLREVDLKFNLLGLGAWCITTFLFAYKLYIRNLTR
ncbi:MAG: ABC transporter permease [Desulfurococcaceae archaeon]|nr:ABC transporter permease [Desulfurococcaceae archaeon]